MRQLLELLNLSYILPTAAALAPLEASRKFSVIVGKIPRFFSNYENMTASSLTISEKTL